MLKNKYTICGVEVELQCSAYTPRFYRAQFNRDMILDMKKLFGVMEKGMDMETREIAENMLFAFAYECDETVESPVEFLEKFDCLMLAEKAIAPIVDIYSKSMEMTAEPAKKKGARRAKTTPASSS